MSTVRALGLLAAGMAGLEDLDATGYEAGAVGWRSEDLQFGSGVAGQVVKSDADGWECECTVGCTVGVPFVRMSRLITSLELIGELW